MTARTALLLFLIFVSLPAIAAEPLAKIQGLLINADEMDRDSDTEIVELRGKVQIVMDDKHIEADRARIDLRAKQATFDGSVRMTTPTSTIGGERILLDYESSTGLIYNGFVQSGPVIFEGALLQKTGPEDYYVLNADYTACTNCPASWSFSGNSIRAELGGYAYIRNSILRFGSLPVLWLPFLVVPLKSDRQSGLLTPSFEQSTVGGFAFAQPYFWAISRSTDATLTAKNYERRGLKGLFNYRYMMDENSGGEFDGAFLRDAVFRNDTRLNEWRSADQKGQMLNRWFIKYAHYEELPDEWVARAVLNNASDLQYPRDFPKETLNHGDSAMENRVSMTKNTESRHFSIDSSYYVNLLQGNPLGGNDDPVHRLPEIRWAQTPTSIGRTGLYYAVDLDFTNFTRSGPAYDNLSSPPGSNIRYVSHVCSSGATEDPRRYGSDPGCVRTDDGYQPYQDLIRTGQRFEIQPTLMYPISLANGAVGVLPKVSYRETHYNFPIEGESNTVRRSLRTELGTRVSFSRVYGDLQDPKGTRYKHEIRPEVTYTALPWIDHRSHPFFGFTPQAAPPIFENNVSVTDSDLFGETGLQFDYRDRLYDRNLVTYSFVNTVTEKRWINEAPAYKQIALVKLSQSYDAWKDSRPNRNKLQPYSDISLLADLRFDHFDTLSTFNYFPYQKVTNSSARARFRADDGKFIQLGVVQAFAIQAGEAVDYKTRTEDYLLEAGTPWRYINAMGKFTYDARSQESDLRKRLKSWAYILQLKPPGDCWIITFTQDQVTGGETSFNVSFDFIFDGRPRAPLPQSTLDQFGF